MLARMRAAELAEERCSIARPASLLGDRWTLVILRQCFNGIKRFEDFQSTLGISRSLLSERLGRLVDAGVLRREPYKDAVRTRDRYRLTEMGLDLYPVLIALRDWGDRYLEGDCPPVEIRHRDCGGEPTLELRCDKCGEEVGAKDAEIIPGPGLKVA
jgi:DNA-binding HxlR family transcriptional regulator